MALHFQTNATPANWTDCLYRLLQTMSAAGWQTIAWSDGTTPHNTPVANSFPYSTGALGPTAYTQLDNSRAWIVMQQPPTSASLTVGAPYAGTRQWVAQRHTSDNRQWRIKYSFSGAYTNPSAAGTAANTPVQNTAIGDEQFIIGGGTDAAPTFGFSFGGGTNGGSRCDCMADDGYFVSGSNPYPYGFYMVTFTAGAGSGCETEICMDPMISGSFPPGELEPFCFGSMSTNINNSVFNPYNGNQRFSDANGAGVHLTWFGKGLPAQQWAGCASAFFTLRAQGFQNAYPQGIGANSMSNEDDLLPVPQVRGAQSGGRSGYKGMSSLMRYTSSVKSTGTAMSVATNRDRIVMNTITLPWDGSLPVV